MSSRALADAKPMTRLRDEETGPFEFERAAQTLATLWRQRPG
jgi:hypothetical protein